MADGGEDRGDSWKRCLEEEEGELVCEAPGLGQGFFTWAAHRSHSGVLPWSQLCLEPPGGSTKQTSAPGTFPETATGRLCYRALWAPWRQVQCTCVLLTAEKLAPARADFLTVPSFAWKENSFVPAENLKVNKEKEHLEGGVGKREVNM